MRALSVAALTPDFGTGNLQSEFLGLLHLELLVDQLIEDLLACRSLVRRQLIELGALLDVERGDRLAVDDNDHLLGAGGGRQDRSAGHQDYGGHQFAAGRETLEHHRFIRFLAHGSRHLAIARAPRSSSGSAALGNARVANARRRTPRD